MLLNDTTLNSHQYKKKIAETNVCECGEGIEDVQHYLLQCHSYEEPRKVLMDELLQIWSNCKNIGSKNVSVTTDLLLSSNSCANREERTMIQAAVFTFIKSTGRCL
jgi:hypothetical protein